MGEFAPKGWDPIFCKECGNRVGWLSPDYEAGAYLCDECAKQRAD